VDTVKHKHKYKKIKTLPSFNAYAYDYVALMTSGDMGGISISMSISQRLSANQLAPYAYANMSFLNVTATLA